MIDEFETITTVIGDPLISEGHGTVGHNRPPISEVIADEFNAKLADKEDRKKALLEAAGRAIAIDDDTARKCGDLVKQIKAMIGHAGDVHAEVKAPVLAATKIVDAARREYVAPLELAAGDVSAKVGQYMREQDEKARAEARRIAEAERLRRENNEAAQDSFKEPVPASPLPVQAPERQTIKTDMGTSIRSQLQWVHQITDVRGLPDDILNHPHVREVMDKVIKSMIRTLKISSLSGCTFTQEHVTKI